jgi:hypothetical protein
VTPGASLADGAASSPNTNRRWPNDLAKRLADSGRTVGVLNEGISNNRLLKDGTGPSVLNRFDRQSPAEWGSAHRDAAGHPERLRDVLPVSAQP